jgi:hypothetical protein
MPRFFRPLVHVFVIAGLLRLLFPAGVQARQTTGSSWVNVTGNLAGMASECGNLTSVSAVPGSSSVLAGVALKGLWANTSGTTWTNLGQGASSATILNRPTSIAYDPEHPGVFWESGIYNGQGVFKTIDGGNIFTALGSVSHNDFISVDFSDPNRQTLVAGGHEQDHTIWKSVNGGQNWTNIGSTLPAGTTFSSNPLVLDSQTYLISTGNGSGGTADGIYRTINGGTSWTQVSNVEPSGPPLKLSNGSIFYPSSDGVLKSTDNGVTWNKFTGGLQQLPRTPIVALPSGRLAAVGFDTVKVSSDGGATWQALGPAFPFDLVWSITYSATRKLFFISQFDCTSTVPNDAVFTLSYDDSAPVPAPMALDKTSLKFGAVTSGGAFVSQTAAQTVRLRQNAPGTVTWTAASNQPWLQVSPALGTGSADLSISVSPSGAPAAGTINGSITFTFTGASNNPGPINVSLDLLPNGTTANPFGTVDTPTDNRTGVTGAIPFTGWALDDVEVSRVMICRAAVGAEVPPVSDPNCAGASQIFVGFAVFIDGARPDVQAAYPGVPVNTRAGWGFMVLTNMLPDIPRGLPAGGNGLFQFFIYAQDRDGHSQLLGTRTMTCANASATLPFGAIDTPGQGGVASATNFVNFGWALTPPGPTAPFKIIPIDGSTITVVVDGNPIGTVNYNHERPDIEALFPDYQNTAGANGAIGFRVIDTTTLTNGLHTISWTVVDNAGAIEGIGSRFFTVSNGVSAVTAAEAVSSTAEAASTASPDLLPLDTAPIAGRRGWDLEAPFRVVAANGAGRFLVRSEEVSRIELKLAHEDGVSATGETQQADSARYAGYLRTGRSLAPLPIGSRLDAASGDFTWAPGVGFVGTYDLVFVRSGGSRPASRQDVRVILLPKGRGSVGPQVEIDAPKAGQQLRQPFLLGGWAADLNALDGTGVSTLHAWAYPIAGGPPVFLGAVSYGGSRPDVAAVHGDQFRTSGFGLAVQGLAPGSYDLAVFAWSTELNGFVAPKSVRVSVR